jgi:hypothetical protein
MSAVLVYSSQRCKYCAEVIEFIKNNPVIIPLLKTHDIIMNGVPRGIERVPTIVTSSGEKHVDVEVLRWLENMIPTTFEGCSSGKCKLASSFDEPYDGVGDGFPLDAYGISLSPQMTPELQARIEKPIGDAYADIKKKVGI